MYFISSMFIIAFLCHEISAAYIPEIRGKEFKQIAIWVSLGLIFAPLMAVGLTAQFGALYKARFSSNNYLSPKIKSDLKQNYFVAVVTLLVGTAISTTMIYKPLISE